MRTKRTLEERQRAEREMWEWLKTLPVAKGNPFSYYEALTEQMSVIEKTIKRLKAFIAFLRKLDPTQYLKWMNDAFSRYTPGKHAPKAAAAASIPEKTIPARVATPAPIVAELPSTTYKP